MPGFAVPRGTRDFLPGEMAVRNHVERLVRGSFESYGYRQIQTPLFEQYELLAARSGEAIREAMFTFASDAGRYALRPELTSPVCRLAASGQLDDLPRPHRLYYLGACFRYCRPQPGRYREFYQAGVELIGVSDPLADAEVIALAARTLANLGISRYHLRIGDVSFHEAGGAAGPPEHLTRVCEWLKVFGAAQFEIVPGLARGFEFYTGTVFEILASLPDGVRPLCGGGRYDRLIEEFGGPPTPATGFALGFDHLVDACQALKPAAAPPAVDAVVVSPETGRRLAVETAERLRGEGFRVAIPLDGALDLAGQLEYGRQLAAEFVVLVGVEGTRSSDCRLRHQPTAAELTVPLALLADEMHRRRTI